MNSSVSLSQSLGLLANVVSLLERTGSRQAAVTDIGQMKATIQS